jgi:hypothetical protein
MITKLQIQNFRGLRNVSLDGLRRVNLLVGGNDTGKTSVLEALVLLLGDNALISELPIAFRNNQTGGSSGNNADDRENFWSWLFYDRETSNKIEINARIDENKDLRLATQLVPEGNYINAPRIPVLTRSVNGLGENVLRFNAHDVQVQAAFSPSGFKLSRLSVRPSHPVLDAEKYNQIALERNGEMRFEQIMREVEPRLKRLRYAKLPGTSSPLVFVDLGLSRAVPATQMGQAFNRILHIYAEVLTQKTNILLIDEIENGIFSESLPLIWKGLFAVCEEQKVQIFATTHSRECVMAAHQADGDRGRDELSIQRLQIVRGNIEAVRLGAQELEVASKMGLEVRS